MFPLLGGEWTYTNIIKLILILLIVFPLLSLLSNIGLMAFSRYYYNATSSADCLSGNFSHCISPENRIIMLTATGFSAIAELFIVFCLLIVGLLVRAYKRKFAYNQLPGEGDDTNPGVDEFVLNEYGSGDEDFSSDSFSTDSAHHPRPKEKTL